MIKATVHGPIWATKRVENLPGGALLEVEEHGTGRRLVALDQLGSGPGEVVLLTLGSGVAAYFGSKAPIDALVVGVVDESPSVSSPRHVETSSTNRKETQNEQ